MAISDKFNLGDTVSVKYMDETLVGKVTKTFLISSSNQAACLLAGHPDYEEIKAGAIGYTINVDGYEKDFLPSAVTLISRMS